MRDNENMLRMNIVVLPFTSISKCNNEDANYVNCPTRDMSVPTFHWSWNVLLSYYITYDICKWYYTEHRILWEVTTMKFSLWVIHFVYFTTVKRVLKMKDKICPFKYPEGFDFALSSESFFSVDTRNPPFSCRWGCCHCDADCSYSHHSYQTKSL